MHILLLFLVIVSGSTSILADPTTSGSATSEIQTKPMAGYDKNFFLQSNDGKFRLNVSGYFQELFESRTNEGAADTDTFRVRRARVRFTGHVYSENIQYALEYDFPTSRLTNSYLQWVACDAFRLKIGNTYVPFDLETLTSSSALAFVDRSIFYSYFGIPDQYEPGLVIGSQLANKKVELTLGMFNGEGINTTNQNHEFRYAGRLDINVSGNKGYEWVDFKRSTRPQLLMGLAGMFNNTPDSSTIPTGGTTPTNEKKVYSFTSDVSGFFEGFSAAAAYGFQRTNPEVGATKTDHGYYLQAGYLISDWNVEPVARVSKVYVDGPKNQNEYSVGFNFYFYGEHAVKLQTDFSVLKINDGIVTSNDRIDYRGRAQLQVKI